MVKFAEPANLSCSANGTVVVGNTEGGSTAHRIRNPFFVPNATDSLGNAVYGPEFVFDSPEAIYTFEVAEFGGSFLFDTCVSSFTTSISIYRLNQRDPADLAASVLVWPTTNQTMIFPTTNPIPDTRFTAIFPYVGGCGALSLNTRSPFINLTIPGLYSVVIQAGQTWDDDRPAYGGANTGRCVCCGFIHRTCATISWLYIAYASAPCTL
jgi:hypothetical protein